MSSTSAADLPPPLPARPDYSSGVAPSLDELSPRPISVDTPHPAFTNPELPGSRPEEEGDYFSRPGGRAGSPSNNNNSTTDNNHSNNSSNSNNDSNSHSHSRSNIGTDDASRPPRRHLTSGNIPTNAIGYTRNPDKVIAYLIPLPAPMKRGQTMNVPQRYFLYTPPAPHLLKPEGGQKEGKRHKAKRVAQQEVRKAKTYEGKTLSWRGLHSKTLRGCDWAVAAIRNVDITFLNRVPRRDVDELVFVHPTSVLDGDPDRDVAARTRGQVRAEFVAQLGRARRKAAKHSVISVALFGPAIVVDTFAVVVWPFGGLAEIDAVWAYVSLSGWLTARSVTRRLADAPTASEEAAAEAAAEEEEREERERQRQRQEEDADASPRTRAMRQVRFRENLEDRDDDEDEQDLKMGGVGGKDRSKRGKGSLKVRFVTDAAMGTMESYFQEACHRRNPRAFKSPGVPPTQTDVLASIGWFPDRRGRAPGVEREEDWSDESWQTRQAKEDIDRVMKKAAKQWDKWCKSYAKYPERAMKEKGHSVTSEVMRKLRIKKGMPPTST